MTRLAGLLIAFVLLAASSPVDCRNHYDEGWAEYELGKGLEAEERWRAYNECSSKAGFHGEAAYASYLVSKALASTGKLAEAVTAARGSIQGLASSGDRRTAEAEDHLVDLFVSQGETDAALDVLRDSWNIERSALEDARRGARTATLFHRLGRTREADAAYSEAFFALERVEAPVVELLVLLENQLALRRQRFMSSDARELCAVVEDLASRLGKASSAPMDVLHACAEVHRSTGDDVAAGRLEAEAAALVNSSQGRPAEIVGRPSGSR